MTKWMNDVTMASTPSITVAGTSVHARPRCSGFLHVARLFASAVQESHRFRLGYGRCSLNLYGRWSVMCPQAKVMRT